MYNGYLRIGPLHQKGSAMDTAQEPPRQRPQPFPPAARATSPTTPTSDTKMLLLQEIRRRRQQAVKQVRSLRRNHSWMTYSGATCSGLATLIAGWAAATGPIVGEGTPAWKMTCGVVAVFTAAAGMLAGVQQGSHLADRLSRLAAHAAKLGALEVALTVSGRDPSEVAREYETLISENTEPDL